MNYQWYPGHMTKAMRMMQEDIKLIDLIVEVVDARIPRASRNPDIDKLGANKGRLVLLNKSDLADKKGNEAWLDYYKKNGITALLIDSKQGSGLKQIQDAVQIACKEKMDRDRKRGIMNRPLRAMVAGIPNVGKSTFINAYAKKSCTKTGNKPGVTKGKQWIRLNKNLELLDTPGVLWPKFEDQTIGLHIAMIGSINDEILQEEELVYEIIGFMMIRYPGRLEERYGISDSEKTDVAKDFCDAKEDGINDMEESHPAEENNSIAKGKGNLKKQIAMLEKISVQRGCLIKGGLPDCKKAAGIVIDDFRSGKLGRITIELPEA